LIRVQNTLAILNSDKVENLTHKLSLPIFETLYQKLFYCLTVQTKFLFRTTKLIFSINHYYTQSKHFLSRCLKWKQKQEDEKGKILKLEISYFASVQQMFE